MGEIVVGIDIGTSKVCALIGRINSLGQVEVLGKGFEVCSGVKKGTIVDIESMSTSIKAAVGQAEAMAEMKIKSAYVNISGIHLSVMTHQSWIQLAEEKREVTEQDVADLLEKVRRTLIPEGNYIIDVIPRQYKVDSNDGIIDPAGMTASMLGIDADLVLAKSASVHNIMKCMEKAGVKIEGLVIESLATGSMLLTQDERQMGVLLIDIGGEITDITIIRNNNLLFTGALPVGGEHITNDIAIGLKIPFGEAEKFKKQYDLALTSLIKYDQEELVSDIGDSTKKSVKISQMVEIVEARVYEIFSLCKEQLQTAGIDDIPGIVLTGRGISFFDGAVELAQEVFQVPVRIVSLKGNAGIKLEHSTCAGMIKYAAAHCKNSAMVEANAQEKKKGLKTTGESIGEKIANFFRNLF